MECTQYPPILPVLLLQEPGPAPVHPPHGTSRSAVASTIPCTIVLNKLDKVNTLLLYFNCCCYTSPSYFGATPLLQMLLHNRYRQLSGSQRRVVTIPRLQEPSGARIPSSL